MRIGDLRKKGFGRDVLTLVTGTALAQAIPILLQPILRRTFSVEDFGAMAVYLSIAGILVVISTLRYEMAIVLPSDDKEASSLMGLSFLICIGLNLLFFIAIRLSTPWLGQTLSVDPRYWNWFQFIPLSSFLLSTYQILNYWLIRKKGFRALSVNKFVRRSAEGIVQVGTGTVKWPAGLVAGDIAGNFLNVVSGLYQVWKRQFRLSDISRQVMRKMALRYKGFAYYQAFPALLNTASLMLPVLIVSRHFKSFETAQFDLSRMVLALPMALISISLSQVLLQRIAEKRQSSEPLRPLISRLFRNLILATLPAITIIGLFGPWLFGFVFSDSYVAAGEYSRILVIAFSLQFVVSPLSIVFSALERMKVAAIWQTSYFLAIASLLFLKGLSIYNFLWIFSAITALAYSVYFALIWKVSSEYDRSIKDAHNES